MMTWRTRITILGALMLVIVLAALPLNTGGATAAPLRQIPPTNTNTPVVQPTNTFTPPPANTNTPIPPANTNTPVPPGSTNTPVPPANTSTPRPPQTPRPGGGGGAPPGPSGTPVVNGCVRSIGRNGISLGSEPGFYKPHVQIVPRDQLALVLAGPERVDTIWWWQLQAESGAVGWGNQDEMTPDPGPCGGSVSSGQGSPPYPVTVLPAFAGEQPAVAATVPPQQPVAQATAASQESLPQTGSSLDLWWLAALLAVTVVVVGFARRRLHTQPVAPGTDSDETTPSNK
jgi:hypothetical protein